MAAPKPFDIHYSPQFAVLLNKLGVSLVLSTYQAGKVIVISPKDEDRLIQLPRNYASAMGIAYKDGQMAIATLNSVVYLKNYPRMAKIYPSKPGVYDAMYLPRVSYHTGYLALHDMAFLNGKLVAVNTMFSCLSYIDHTQSFIPFWKPPFISELKPEDRCHLNGLAIEGDEIKYVSALSNTDTPYGWREHKIDGGIIMEYPSGKIIASGLGMPHSPRIYKGKLYVLNSVQGTLVEVDPATGSLTTVAELGGFARGLDFYEDYAFIGVSKIRHNSPVFRDLPIAKTSFAGIIAVYLPYGSIVGAARYQMSVDEIYDVKVLPGQLRPNILSPAMDILKGAIVTGDQYYWSDITEDKNAKPNQENINNLLARTKLHLFSSVPAKELVEKFEPLICPKNLPRIKHSSGKYDLLVASVNNVPVAMAVFDYEQSGDGRLHSVFVDPKLRRHTLATVLIREMERIMAQNGVKHLKVTFDIQGPEYEIFRRLLGKIQAFEWTVETQ